jgi:hypothetical protein
MPITRRVAAEFLGTAWLGATDRRAPAGFAPIAIGLGLRVAPILGAAGAGIVYPLVAKEQRGS